MTKIRLKDIRWVRKRRADGTVVEYHSIRGRKGSTFWRSDSSVPKGSSAYVDAYRTAMRPSQPETAETFGDILTRFLASEEFKGLKERTQADYRKWIDRIREKWGRAPVEAFNDPRIRKQARKWRDQWAHSPKQSDYAITILARVVSWAVDDDESLEAHHLQNFKRRYKSGRAEIIWPPAYVEQFCATAPEWARRILVTAVETGLRPGDLIRLSRNHIEATPKGRRIRIRTGKRNQLSVIPVTPAMAEIIDATPADRMLILVSERGRPLTPHRASEGVRQWKEKAGLSHAPRLYDARGTACTALLRAGLELDKIARIMGWSVRYAAHIIETYATIVPEVSDEVLVRLSEARAGQKGNSE